MQLNTEEYSLAKISISFYFYSALLYNFHINHQKKLAVLSTPCGLIVTKSYNAYHPNYNYLN